jgi:maltoporin
MSSYPFNSSFTKQFRQEQPVTFCAEEKPFQQIVLSTYGRKTDEEINALGKSLNEQLFDNNIIHHLLTKLTQNDTRDAARLTAFVQETHQELRNHASSEPFTAQYYKHLMELLTSFQELVNEYDMNGQELLLGNLNACYFHENSFAVSQSVDSEEVATMHRIIEDFLYQIGEFYQYFHMLLQKESEQENNKSRVQVMSHVSYYLDTLITCTEKMIINTEITLDMLLEWETALQTRESQELFN